ncbi:unnamed protein product [Amoebophrya sp. A25]|nr:unnamed protein product [Amoebophrya sp. A25]|eukprot:GSA25T00002717001.1
MTPTTAYSEVPLVTMASVGSPPGANDDQQALLSIPGTESLGNRRVSVYSKAEQDGIAKCLEIVEKTAEKRKKDGFNDQTFAIGVLNTLLVTYIFARYPQHFWILYIAEGSKSLHS